MTSSPAGRRRGPDRRARLRPRAARLVALAAALVVLSACAPAAAHDSDPAGAATPGAPLITPAAARSAAHLAAAKRQHRRATPRPARKPRQKHRHLAASSGDVVNASGAVLPNRARTPGVVNPAVTQATIGRTICVSGWTSTVRPSSSVTTALKVAQLASGYAYRGDVATGDYEEDHLISLELGGAPSDPRNLWPEPYGSAEGARVKDAIENRLHALVCGHSISLATAQHAIATNWWAAYTTYVGSVPMTATAHTTAHSTGHTTAHHAPPPAPAPATPGNGATARCNDGTYSYAAHHQGACSHHGGVQVFYR